MEVPPVTAVVPVLDVAELSATPLVAVAVGDGSSSSAAGAQAAMPIAIHVVASFVRHACRLVFRKILDLPGN